MWFSNLFTSETQTPCIQTPIPYDERDNKRVRIDCSADDADALASILHEMVFHDIHIVPHADNPDRMSCYVGYPDKISSGDIFTIVHHYTTDSQLSLPNLKKDIALRRGILRRDTLLHSSEKH